VLAKRRIPKIHTTGTCVTYNLSEVYPDECGNKMCVCVCEFDDLVGSYAFAH